MLSSDLPKEIGAKITIPACDPLLRREIEGRGFVIEYGDQQTYLMRRMLHDGVLKTDY